MRKVLVDIPFVYPAHAVMPRHRKPASLWVYDTVTVAMAVADPGDLVPAFRMARHVHGERKNQWPALTERDTRGIDVMWDGKTLYVPLGDNIPAPCGEWPSIPSGDRHWWASSPFLDFVRGNGGMAEFPAHAVPGRVVNDRRAETVGKIRKLADRVVAGTDGWLTVTGEPVWVVRPRNPYSVPSVVTVLPELLPDSAGRFGAGAKSRADALAEALDWAAEPGCHIVVEGSIEVLVPEAMTAPIMDINLMSIARQTLEHRTQSLPRASIAFLDAWATLRDSLEGCGPTVDPLVDAAVCNYLDVCGNDTTAQAPALERAHALLRGWRDGIIAPPHPRP